MEERFKVIGVEIGHNEHNDDNADEDGVGPMEIHLLGGYRWVTKRVDGVG